MALSSAFLKYRKDRGNSLSFLYYSLSISVLVAKVGDLDYRARGDLKRVIHAYLYPHRDRRGVVYSRLICRDNEALCGGAVFPDLKVCGVPDVITAGDALAELVELIPRIVALYGY